MAKKNSLSSNPADAARKAARQRELKKNKADREAVREHALVKKDTSTLENEIRQLERSGKTGPELEDLKSELRKAKGAKDKYLEKHPEHKKFIYPHSQEQKAEETGDHGRGLFRPDGKPRFPERSVYYHPVFNPWGAPPPGMPYAEKPPHEWASSSQLPAQPPPPSVGSSLPNPAGDSDDDDDIAMPPGPPPPKATQNGATHTSDHDSEDDDDDDDIVMPSGPPPSAALLPRPPFQPQQPIQPHLGIYSGPPPYGVRPPPPPPVGGYPGPHRAAPGPMTNRPPYPSHLSQGPMMRPAPRPGHPYARTQARPPVPPGLAHPAGPANGAPPSMARPRPPPDAPLGPSAARSSTSTSVSAAPSIGQTAPAAPSATISSAPQLRDLKKEAVTFLPPSVRKQKSKAQQKAKMAGLSRGIRANPDVGDEDESEHTFAGEISTEQQAQQEVHNGYEEAEMNEEEEERREPQVSLEAAQLYVPSVQEASPGLPAALKELSPPLKAEKKTSVMPSLVGYYDSDEEGSGDEDSSELDETDSHNQERKESPSAKATASSTVSKATPAQGRVNLVEALKAQMPASAQPKKAADGDYEKWLQSIGGA
ncbi:hypothetical protein BCV69DRAFT_280778 [Microstroma glucosiphilum]|uniref:Wbp11/ELF5/Saf1 N-terminal domain-containing protein n=1 Tax=Pseudomicrostroma glucosiphilum TaxID=1684307 RepID=A0A316UD92_9BASI|nr:hypothetical protein BCV69DRAFT_280778 [Pseudomicrostroma glucosiphilum]PWN23166.1 hypothetical protein BCV69DRAFT_280778 [Pseudomicrostroma glucosiphilum]